MRFNILCGHFTLLKVIKFYNFDNLHEYFKFLKVTLDILYLLTLPMDIFTLLKVFTHFTL